MFDIDELRRSKSSESSDATKADDDDDMPELSESGRDDLVDQFKHLTQETVEGAGPEDYKEMLKTLGLLRSKLQEKDQQIEKMLEVSFLSIWIRSSKK